MYVLNEIQINEVSGGAMFDGIIEGLLLMGFAAGAVAVIGTAAVCYGSYKLYNYVNS